MNKKEYMLNKSELKKLIEPFIYKQLADKDYKCRAIDSHELLTWNRLDLAFKLCYIGLKNKNLKLAKRIYTQDIKAQTLGDFKEFGNDNKNSIEMYIEEFDKTFDNIKEKGFDKTKTIVPLSNDQSILNGAHRIASALYLQAEVECVEVETTPYIIDYKYFYERNVTEDVLDIVVKKFIEYSDNTYIAFLWPSGIGQKEEAESKFSNIVYRKKINLNAKGAINLLIELYKHMDWVGNEENKFQGVHQKLLECFPTFESVHVIVFQSNSLDEVRVIKEEVRGIYNIGFSSIHITDTNEEAIRISQLLFNENGLHFLNYANPYKYLEFHKEVEAFNTFLSENSLDTNDIIIDSSSVLSLYGIRKNNDLDYLSIYNPSIESFDYDAHDETLDFHKVSKQNIIYNPSFYFQYKGLKFVSFQQLYEMKRNRNEEKDRNDCSLMNTCLTQNSYKKWLAEIKQKIFYFKIKSRKNITLFKIYMLKKTGLYTPVKWLYYKVKGVKK